MWKLFFIPLALLSLLVFLPSKEPQLGAYTGERGFRGIDEKVVKSISYKEGMTEATITFYGKNGGPDFTKTIPFTWEQKGNFETKLRLDIDKVKRNQPI